MPKHNSELSIFNTFDTKDWLQIISMLLLAGIALFNYYHIEAAKLELETTKTELEEAKVENDAIRIEIEKSRLKIEKTKSTTEQANLALNSSKFLSDIPKFLSDLRPKILGECRAALLSQTQLKVDCSTKNEGLHSLSFNPPQVRLRIRNSNINVDPAYFRQTFSSGNWLPNGLAGGNTILLNVFGNLDWSKIEIVTEINAVTDETITLFAKELLKDKLTPERVDLLSKQSFAISTEINQSSPIR